MLAVEAVLPGDPRELAAAEKGGEPE